MITSHTPVDWKDLQSQVARILAECGFSVDIEKLVATVRGSVELDVRAEESVDGRGNSIICECKHWRTPVPQTVVHAFRTVVADIGVNVGYIISSAGFQKGAFEAAANSNIRLVTWPEFQKQFELSWYERFFYPEITERLDSLFSYTEIFLPAWFERLSEEDKKKLIDLKKKYVELNWLLMNFTTYARMSGSSAAFSLPLIGYLDATSGLRDTVPMEVLSATTPREFLVSLIPYGEIVVSQFEEIRPKDA